MTNSKEHDEKSILGFKDPVYQFQALRALSATSLGAADICECLKTFSLIEEGNNESWYTEWNLLAERIEKEAKTSAATYHNESAKSAFFRASNYYRNAEFFLHGNPDDPRILSTWGKSRDCFLNALPYLKNPVKKISIPFENTSLPGYLCLVDSALLARPLVIVQTGFDGTAEEVYFTHGQAAIARGYNCLIFEGPGQGAVIREQKIPFRYNWETVITPVVDFVEKMPHVQQDRIALIGISMGGYLVPRALAFEHRIELGIANGGVYDFHELCLGSDPQRLKEALDNPKAQEEINQEIFKMMKTNSMIRWGFEQGMYTFQAATPVEWLLKTKPYFLQDVIQDISCKMLVVDSDQDLQMGKQSKLFYDALHGSKEYMLFKEEEGAGAHCQVGAYQLSNERIFNWLDDNL